MVDFLVSSFGFWILHRTKTKMMFRTDLSSQIRTGLHRIIYFVELLLIFLTVLRQFLVIIGIEFASLILILNFNLLMNRYLRWFFLRNLVLFFDELILYMSMGRAFRDAIVLLLERREDSFTFKMREIYNWVVLDPRFGNRWSLELKNGDPSLYRLMSWFSIVDQQPHRALDRLRQFRRQLYWEQSFRQKSEQATAQVRIQAMVLSVIYFGLLIFVVCHQKNVFSEPILVSLTLYFSGLLLIVTVQRRWQWKT